MRGEFMKQQQHKYQSGKVNEQAACSTNRLYQAFLYVLMVMAAIMLVSCFPSKEESSSKSSSIQLEQKQNVAMTYARSLQQYAAMSQQAVIKDMMQEGNIDVSTMSLIDMDTYAAQYNLGRSADVAQSGICGNKILTWMKPSGDANTPGMKGLGETGYSSVSQALSRQLSSSSYGIYKEGVLTFGADRDPIQLGCEVARYIPEGSPVITSTMTSVDYIYETTETQRQETACPSGNGVIVQTRSRSVEMNRKTGEETAYGTWGDWQTVSSVCNDTPSIVSLERSSAASDNETSAVNFAAGGLNAQETEECFTATINRSSSGAAGGQGNHGSVDGLQETISNCSSFGVPSGDITDPLDYEDNLVCDTANPTVESRTLNCTGNGWTGTATYERNIYDCEMVRTYDNGSEAVVGSYTRRDSWQDDTIQCERNENLHVSCPHTGGVLSYSRTNEINTFDLNPTNPNWSYVSGSCYVEDLPGVSGVRNCVDTYLGNTEYAPTSLSGTYTRSTSGTDHRVLNASDRRPLANACGSGNQCTEINDAASCEAGYNGTMTQERTFACSAVNTGSWGAWATTDSSGCTAACSWQGGFPIAYSSDVSNAMFDMSCGAINPAPITYPFTSCTAGDSCSSAGARCLNSTGSCNFAGSGTADTYESYRCVCTGDPSPTCTADATDTETRACQVGSGNETRSRTCNGAGTAWSSWSAWDTSSCTTTCTPNSTETQACGAGFSGNEVRTCNASGTAWGAWDDSACSPTAPACSCSFQADGWGNYCESDFMIDGGGPDSCASSTCNQANAGSLCMSAAATVGGTCGPNMMEPMMLFQYPQSRCVCTGSCDFSYSWAGNVQRGHGDGQPTTSNTFADVEADDYLSSASKTAYGITHWPVNGANDANARGNMRLDFKNAVPAGSNITVTVRYSSTNGAQMDAISITRSFVFNTPNVNSTSSPALRAFEGNSNDIQGPFLMTPHSIWIPTFDNTPRVVGVDVTVDAP